MSCYIISYDLRKERDYQSLYDAIKGFDNWADILESTWAVVSDKTAVEIRTELLSHMDDDDRLFIIKSGMDSAWRHVLCDDSWLEDNI